ncbi:MAG: hypothetical protein WCM76_09260 [Bacteroidota bacterium]
MNKQRDNKTGKKRAFAALLFALRMFAPAVSGFIISILVVHYFSKELWGSVANISLWVFLFTGIASWGSKDYLLRQFSLEPSRITHVYSDSLLTRAILLPLLSAMLYFLTGRDIMLWLYCTAWLAARFVYTSFEPIVIFDKKFGMMAMTELTGACIVAAYLLLTPTAPVTEDIIIVLMLADILKAVFVSLFFYRSLSFSHSVINTKHIIAALPFFLIGMAGLLHSRLEQLIVNTFLSDTEKAYCQVYMNLLLASMAVPSLLITPVTKSLYRASAGTFKKIRIWLLRFGIFAAPLSGIAVWCIVKFVYQFNSGLSILVAGILFCIPVYFYFPAMYEAYKNGRQTLIMIVIASCLVAGSISGFLIIREWGITGAIYNAAFTQWLMLLILLINSKRSVVSDDDVNVYEFHPTEPDL